MAPTGTVTFLFTDIEGSTKLAQDFPDTLQSALERHHSILQNAIESNKGFIFDVVGDAFFSAFENADDAVSAAVHAQSDLAKEKWNEATIKVRIGIHSGEAEWNGNNYMGYITLARSARVMSAAYGEQILLSEDVFRQVTNNFITHKDSGVQSSITFRDLGERKLKDLINPLRIYQVISDNLRKDFPPLKTLDARPNNLPVQLTSFIGREEVIAKVKSLFRKTRLLTITGTGGGGKTRLSMQIGADVIDEFPNGVYLIELAPLSDHSLIIQTIINSLGIKETQGQTPDETLIEYLRDKEMLLLLDNCEHLIHECAEAAEVILSKCPKVKIIATSREPLNCSGEQTFRIPSLMLPQDSSLQNPEELIQNESVRLFVERALSVNTGFRLNKENAPSIAGICSRLDGIPLAIELAAARVKIISAEKIHERLDDRFNLLTGGKRTALPRQQTLRAMIDWSYDLLSEKEKILCRRLSVFAGGWDITAAEEICSDEKIHQSEMLDLLHKLNEKSIIIYEERHERFRMLETLKQYANEKLHSSNEAETLSERHLEYYLKFATNAETLLAGKEMPVTLNRLENERGNFERCMLYSTNIADKSKGIALAAALGSFWKIRGHYSEGSQWLQKFIVHEDQVSKKSFAKTLSKLGRLDHLKGDVEISYKHLLKSIAIFRETDDRNGLAEALSNTGQIKFEKGEYDSARKLYEEALNIFRETGHTAGVAYSLGDIATLLVETGEYENARKLFEESVELHRQTGEDRGIAYALYNLGNIAMEQGDLRKGCEIFDECTALFKTIDEKRGMAFSMCSLGNIKYHLGEPEESKCLLDECISLFRQVGDKRGITFSLGSRANIALQEKDYATSTKYLEESLAIGRETDSKPTIAFVLFSLGNSNYAQGNIEQAKKYFEESYSLSTEIGHKPGIAFNLNNLANIALIENEPELAAELFKKSLILNKELNQKKELATNLIGIAELNFKRGRCSDSVKLLGCLKTFSETMGITSDTAEAEKQQFLFSELNKLFDETEFCKLYEEGKAMTPEEAVTLAADKLHNKTNSIE